MNWKIIRIKIILPVRVKTIYVHTMYLNENEFTLNLKGYIVYSDGTKSNEITFGEIKNSYTTWLSIDSASAIKGDATLFIYNTDKKYAD